MQPPPNRPSKWLVGAAIWGAILLMFLIGIAYKLK